jgi:hypothetical protein
MQLADFSTLKTETIRFSETSVHARSTQLHIPEDGILHSHRRENLKSLHTKNEIVIHVDVAPLVIFEIKTETLLLPGTN